METDGKFKIHLEALFSDLDPIEAQEEARQRVIFSALVKDAAEAILASDLEGCQIYANRACYEIFGYDYEQQEMKDLPMVTLWAEESAPLFIECVLPQARHGSWSGEVRQKRKDGSTFEAHLTVFPVLDGADQPISIAAIIRDISAQKQLEQKRLQELYEAHARQVAAVAEIAQEIAVSPTLDELYRRAVQLIKERLGYYHVQIFSCDPEQESMVIVESYVPPGTKVLPPRYKFPYGLGAVGQAAATGRPVLLPDVSRTADWIPHPPWPDTKGELAVPIKWQEEVLGVLDVLSDRRDALTREDEIALFDLAGQIASAIQNIRSLEEANVVRQFAQAPEGIGWITLEGQVIIYINPTLCGILGEARPEDSFGKPITCYYPAESQALLRAEILPAVMREGQWVGEMMLLSQKGRLVSTIQSFFLIHDEKGNPLYIANVVTDVSERKQAELLLEKRIKQLNCLNDIGRRIEESPPVPEFLTWVTERTAQAMQYPQVCLVAIEFNGQLYGSPQALKLPYQFVENLQIGNETVGKICAAYAQKSDVLDGESVFLSDVARRVSGYIESRHLVEQSKVIVEEMKAAHRLYVHTRWTEPPASGAPAAGEDGGKGRSTATSLAEPADRIPLPPAVATEAAAAPAPVAGHPGEEVGPKGGEKSKSPYDALRGLWQRVTTGMLIALVLLVAGGLLAWTANLQAQAESVASAKAARPGGESAALSLATPITATAPAVPEITVTPSGMPAVEVEVGTLAYPTTPDVPRFVPTPASQSTPFPTPTPTPLFVVPTPFATPGPHGYVPSSTLLIPTPVQPVPLASDAINIAILGSDQRPDWSEWHTDVVQIVSIQRNSGTVSVVSIPRDLYIYIPSMWMSRINFADFYGEDNNYPGGGPALLRDTMLYNLGLRIDYYARTNFDGLIGIVDTLGGVDVPVHCPLSDYWPYKNEAGVYPILSMEPGIRHMDGETALWYARSRKTTSVFSRERRQQQVLQAIWRRARDTGMLTKVPELWIQAQSMVTTDLTLADVLGLAEIAIHLPEQNVRFYNIGAAQVTPWVTPHGGSVFLPRWEAIEPILAEAMAPVPEARLSRVYYPVEVWNGTENPDWDDLAVDRLYRAGFPAVIGQPDHTHYPHTQLLVFTDHTKGIGIEYLQELFKIPDNQVIRQSGGSSEYKLRLLLGADYQTCPEP